MEDRTGIIARRRAQMLSAYLAAIDLGEAAAVDDKPETLEKQPIRLLNREDYPSRQAWRAAKRKGGEA